MAVRQLPMDGGTGTTKHPRFEQVFHRDYRYCDCEMPMLSRKWNDALGTFATIRLCCMAKALEELTGLKLYEVHEFAPRWVWDCEKIENRAGPDGTVEMVEKGPPPRWLKERLLKKGLTIKNLPATPGNE